jgi:predicted amino acid dehydrogenase
MGSWSPSQWGEFFVEAAKFLAALGTFVVLVINAKQNRKLDNLETQFTNHEQHARARAKLIMGKVDEECDEEGGEEPASPPRVRRRRNEE